MTDPIVIAGMARTPMGSFQGALSEVKATDLGAAAVRAAVDRAGVDPARPANALTRAEWERLAALIPEYLRWAIEAQSGRDLKLIGEHGAENVFALYRRLGHPCPQCATPIQRAVIGQRGTYYCPRCQR